MSKFGYIWQFKPVRSIAFIVFMFILAIVISTFMTWADAYAYDCLTDTECDVFNAQWRN